MNLTHPKSGATVDVTDAQAPAYQSQGWVAVEESKPAQTLKSKPEEK